MQNSTAFKVKKLYNNIFLFLFESGYDAAMAFVRVAEFYESEFAQAKGRYFTLEEYMKWYAEKYGQGAFTYPNDWAGWNVPGDHFLKWLNMYRGKFRPMELEVFAETIMNLGEEKIVKSYFIGTYKCDSLDEVITHELAHGLYHMSRTYKSNMNELIDRLGKRERARMEEFVRNLGYIKKMWKDEIQAYIVGGEVHEGYDFSEVALRDEFVEVYKRFKKRGLNGGNGWEE